MKLRYLAGLVVMTVCTANAATAEAPDSPDGAGWTTEHFALQFGVGTYRPDPGDQFFDVLYPGDNGPLLNLEMHFFFYRIPYIGPIGLGLGAGWARYKGTACEAGTTQTGCVPTTQRTKFNLFPVPVFALLRVDGLSRNTPVPLVFIGKVGVDNIFFIEDEGLQKIRGRSHGFRWGVQMALELNFIAPPRAAALDDDWGINSSYLFIEIFGSKANSRANLGDKFAWLAGLGLTF